MKTKHKHWFALTASTLGLTGFSFASGFGDEKYTYDASGNVLEKQIGDQITRYDYTGNQLVGSASDSSRKQYAYDASGRLTSDSEAGKPTRKMEHQYLDKVTKVQNADKTTEFFYNAEGQLVATNSAGTSETFAWDGLAMVSRGEQLYVNEAHAVGGVPAIVGNDVAVSDMIGSSLSVGDSLLESTAFGEGLSVGLFTGKPFIEELGSFIFNFRIYSAEDLRWSTLDPSGYPDGSNTKCYVKNDPINLFDKNGLASQAFNIDYQIPGAPNMAHHSGLFEWELARGHEKSNIDWKSPWVGTISYAQSAGNSETIDVPVPKDKSKFVLDPTGSFKRFEVDQKVEYYSTITQSNQTHRIPIGTKTNKKFGTWIEL